MSLDELPVYICHLNSCILILANKNPCYSYHILHLKRCYENLLSKFLLYLVMYNICMGQSLIRVNHLLIWYLIICFTDKEENCQPNFWKVSLNTKIKPKTNTYILNIREQNLMYFHKDWSSFQSWEVCSSYDILYFWKGSHAGKSIHNSVDNWISSRA